ncbi:MAG: formate dehydrogenase accessory sulfurtransferase FdhD [Longimicrobiales bacterium]
MSHRKSTSTLQVERLEPGARKRLRDPVAVEEPMEIRVETAADGQVSTRSVSVTMRTPGQDFELAAGFLFSEGILASREDLREITYCKSGDAQQYNVVTVRFREGLELDPELLNRNFYTSSSCGVCGKGSLEAVEVRGCQALPGDTLALDPALIPRLPELLLDGQRGFKRSGGLHAAGLFDARGEALALREDVGRHNAVDKVVGQALLEGEIPLQDRILVVSGRTSFEILQKAVAAGIPAVVAVGAPSTLAVEMARRFNVTLVGFARAGRFNLYAGAARVRDWEGET